MFDATTGFGVGEGLGEGGASLAIVVYSSVGLGSIVGEGLLAVFSSVVGD